MVRVSSDLSTQSSFHAIQKRKRTQGVPTDKRATSTFLILGIELLARAGGASADLDSRPAISCLRSYLMQHSIILPGMRSCRHPSKSRPELRQAWSQPRMTSPTKESKSKQDKESSTSSVTRRQGEMTGTGPMQCCAREHRPMRRCSRHTSFATFSNIESRLQSMAASAPCRHQGLGAVPEAEKLAKQRSCRSAIIPMYASDHSEIVHVRRR